MKRSFKAMLNPLSWLEDFLRRRSEPVRGRLIALLRDGCWWYVSALEEKIGKDVSLGLLLNVIKELEQEGIIESRAEGWTPHNIKRDRGGRARKLYRLKPC